MIRARMLFRVRLLGLALASAAAANAQRATGVDAVSVRAEYASTLLQARRYREAASEYRRLVAREPGKFAWRLNLSRALAWGGAYREAETELRTLSARARGNPLVDELLRSVRANIVPSAAEARRWVAERPTHAPYRLALARAHVREHSPRAAYSHFAFVLASQSSASLLAEAADAHAAGGDRRGAVRLYRQALARAPSDPSLRRSYASALAADRQYAAAIEQYTWLFDRRPGPSLLTERAYARQRGGDESGAERDLQHSLALLPTPDAYLALGDLYQRREQFQRARAAYLEVVTLRPGDLRVGSRLVRLGRAARPGFGYAAATDEQLGTTLESHVTGDNAGFSSVSAALRRGFLVGPGIVLGIGVEPRLVRGRSGAPVEAGEVAPARELVGASASLGLAYTHHGDELDARLAGRGGLVEHTADPPVSLLVGSGVLTYHGAWSLSIESRQGPAYAELLALAPDAARATFPASARAFAVGAAAPLGVADVAAEYERTALSDGNTRSVAQASIRLPLAAGLSLLYSGASVGFHERSTLYWDPRTYASHALGIELAARRDDGVALTARVLPGIGRADDGLTAGDPDRFRGAEPRDANFVGQLAANVDLDIRRGRWRTAVGAAFGSGRGGGYKRFDGTLRVLYVP
jgi:tetratricopeptide (TPR) repeat protein